MGHRPGLPRGGRGDRVDLAGRRAEKARRAGTRTRRVVARALRRRRCLDHRCDIRCAQGKMGRIDFLVHAIAFSDKDQLDGRYIETTADNFSNTMLISCYSLTAVAQRAIEADYGAEKWMPHCNVMGVAKAALEATVRYLAADLGAGNIRVNAISAGPIRTLAASGIGDFRYILKWNEYNAPM